MAREKTRGETTERLSFREALKVQRWDDHRYYHHSRINQSLHLLSSICFMITYAMLIINPTAAVMLGWIVAMWSRQIGHFFFEPKTYDEVNHATHEYKEDIKVGYNLNRKRILQSIWAVSPLALFFHPSMFGLFEPAVDWSDYVYNLSMLWLWLAIVALAFRTVHLFFIRDVQTGLVWATKILTDPFNDFRTYLRSPLYLMKGELIDPMSHTLDETGTEEREPAAAH
jgi:hypothetical protein